MSYWKTIYRQQIIESDQQNLDPKGACQAFFENLGTADITINACIPLNANDTPRTFNNLPNEAIASPFTIGFAATGTKKLLVIWKYAQQINEKQFLAAQS